MGFFEKRDDVKAARADRNTKKSNLVKTEGEAAQLEQDLYVAKNTGDDTSTIEGDLIQKKQEKDQKVLEYGDAVDVEKDKLELLTYSEPHKTQVEKLDVAFPILLFPVRIETRFVNRNGEKLLVRFFPDDIAIQTFEKPLMAEEKVRGVEYNLITDISLKKASWDGLCASFGQTRAAWIALNSTTTDIKSSSWTEAPHTKIMPDKFIVKLYKKNIAIPVREVEGNPIPDILDVGINPKDDQSLKNDNNILEASDDIKWMIDFDEAVIKGMAISIPLFGDEHITGFEKLIAVGVKTSSDESVGSSLLEELIDSHHYTNGLAILKQGESVKNTKENRAGYTSFEYGNEISYAVEQEGPLITSTPNRTEKVDGELLADALGVPKASFDHIIRADGTDIQDAKRFANMGFKAVLGNPMLKYGFRWNNYEQIEKLRNFFTEHVRGRGTIPSFRVGKVPYGVLLSADLDKIPKRHPSLEEDLKARIREIIGEMEDTVFIPALDDRRGFYKEGDNPELSFVEGQASTALSNGHFLRFASGPELTWNLLQLEGKQAEADIWYNNQVLFSDEITNNPILGFKDKARITMTSFAPENIKLEKPLIQDGYLSKEGALGSMSGGNMNFLNWLSLANFEDVLDENFNLSGASDKPNSLLYETIRKSLLLDYWHTAANYLDFTLDERIEPELVNIPIVNTNVPAPYEGQGAYNPYNFFPSFNYFNNTEIPEYSYFQYWRVITKAMKWFKSNNPDLDLLEYVVDWSSVEQICMSFEEQNPMMIPRPSESSMMVQNAFSQLSMYAQQNDPFILTEEQYFTEAKYQWNEDVTVHYNKWEIINFRYNGELIWELLSNGRNNGDTQRTVLDSVLDDILYCSDLTPLELDLLFKGLLDCCADRVDAWKHACFADHFNNKRYDSGDNPIHKTYIGAYGWLTNLEPKAFTDFTPSWPQSSKNTAFTSKYGSSVKKDEKNAGFIWTPSLNQAVTTAVLRAGFVNKANQNEPSMLLTNMTSEKIRRVEKIFDAVRSGQDVASILGYRLEKQISESSVNNSFIYELRKEFPLGVKENDLSEQEIAVLAERNTIDGVELLNAIESSTNGNISSMLSSFISNPPQDLIEIVEDLVTTRDAIGDYAISEGMHQLTQGNMPAAKSWLDVDELGSTPPEGRFFKTPRTGKTYTSKVLLNMNTIDFDDSITNISTQTVVEPTLNNWLASLIGGLDQIEVNCRLKDSDDVISNQALTVDNLGFPNVSGDFNPLSPLDLVLMIPDRLSLNASTLTLLIRERVKVLYADKELVDIEFDNGGVNKSLKQVFPLLKQLKKMIKQAQTLSPLDFVSPVVNVTTPESLFDLEDLEDRVSHCLDTFLDLDNAFDGSLSIGDIKKQLKQVSEFGITIALNKDLEDADIYAQVYEAVEQEYLSRKTQIGVVSVPNYLTTLGSEPSSQEIEDYISDLNSIMSNIYGGNYILLPSFTNPSQGVLHNQNSSDLLTNGNINSWFHSEARVRGQLENIEWVKLLEDEHNRDSSTPSTSPRSDKLDIAALQLPYDHSASGVNRWMNFKVSTEEALDNAVCFSVIGDSDFSSSSQKYCGLVIDTWTETLPAEEETTGIALNYDRPKAKAPQACIMAVSPSITGNWSWDDLAYSVNNVYNSAEIRGETYENLLEGFGGQILPATSYSPMEVSVSAP